MQRGYIKLWRSIWDNEFWPTDRPYTRPEAWLDMLMLANYKDTSFRKRGNKINVLRGQIGRSIKGLADRWNWSQSKASRFLDELKNEEQIEYQKNNVTTLITIINYEVYQGNEEQNEEPIELKTIPNGDLIETKPRHIKKDKKDNAGKKVKKKDNTIPLRDEFQGKHADHEPLKLQWSLWHQFRTEIKKKLTPTMIDGQIKKLEKYTPEIAAKMLKQSIENGWQGIFELKTDGKQPTVTAQAEQDRPRLQRELREAEGNKKAAEERHERDPSPENEKWLQEKTRIVNKLLKQLEG